MWNLLKFNRFGYSFANQINSNSISWNDSWPFNALNDAIIYIIKNDRKMKKNTLVKSLAQLVPYGNGWCYKMIEPWKQIESIRLLYIENVTNYNLKLLRQVNINYRLLSMAHRFNYLLPNGTENVCGAFN